MSASWLLTNIIAALLLPPLNLLILCAAGFLMRRRLPRLGPAIGFAALLFLLILSTQAGARWMIASLEIQTEPLSSKNAGKAQAIVILGGGRLKRAPEYGGRDTAGPYTLVRLRYGAKLYRETGLPLMVTGGKPDGADEPEAVLMAKTLREDFAVPVRWLEPSSSNTADNARLSARLLKQAGVQRILLVTDAMHMPRAQAIFTQYGLEVVPAPTTFLGTAPLSAADFIPGASALASSHYAMHEWIGLYWYRFRHRSNLHPQQSGEQSVDAGQDHPRLPQPQSKANTIAI